MKSKKMITGICIIFIIMIGGLIWWNLPYSIANINPSEVSKIDIFDGNTGKSITIIDTIDIEHIIENLNKVSFKKDKISLGYTGYAYRTTIYKMDGNVYKEFIINSKDTIRKDPFFYKDTSESIDYKYIQDLIQDNIEPNEPDSEEKVDSEVIKEYYYEPNVSIIEGTLITRLHYGPPGYGEDPDNDEEVYPFILLLDDAIDVFTEETDEFNSNKSSVLEVQLVLRGEPYIDIAKEYKNQHIKVEGTLFSAFTGHHYTEVLIVVDNFLDEQSE